MRKSPAICKALDPEGTAQAGRAMPVVFDSLARDGYPAINHSCQFCEANHRFGHSRVMNTCRRSEIAPDCQELVFSRAAQPLARDVVILDQRVLKRMTHAGDRLVA